MKSVRATQRTKEAHEGSDREKQSSSGPHEQKKLRADLANESTRLDESLRACPHANKVCAVRSKEVRASEVCELRQ